MISSLSGKQSHVLRAGGRAGASVTCLGLLVLLDSLHSALHPHHVTPGFFCRLMLINISMLPLYRLRSIAQFASCKTGTECRSVWLRYAVKFLRHAADIVLANKASKTDPTGAHCDQ